VKQLPPSGKTICNTNVVMYQKTAWGFLRYVDHQPAIARLKNNHKYIANSGRLYRCQLNSLNDKLYLK
jgi:hypothetical protein